MQIRIALAGFLVPFSILVMACSGGGVSVDIRGPSLSTRPADERVTAIGVIASNDGLVVNGTFYDTSAANVLANGADASPADLKRGHKAFVTGAIGPLGLVGTADTVVFDADLVGQVDAIDPATRLLVVMGQRVLLDNHTISDPTIDAATLEGLSVGDRVSISGFRSPDGDVVSTRVERDSMLSDDQIIGRISLVDVANMTFEVYGLPVDYRRVGLIELPSGAPAAGMTVVATGSLVDGVLVATELGAAAAALPGRASERVLVQGIVTEVSGASGFLLGDAAIRTDAGTDFYFGSARDLAVDVRLIVDGRVAADGQSILADAIRFDH